jgi:hypothetical protein
MSRIIDIDIAKQYTMILFCASCCRFSAAATTAKGGGRDGREAEAVLFQQQKPQQQEQQQSYDERTRFFVHATLSPSHCQRQSALTT